jgi:hypothetical protein
VGRSVSNCDDENGYNQGQSQISYPHGFVDSNDRRTTPINFGDPGMDRKVMEQCRYMNTHAVIAALSSATSGE